ncbi:MAG: hypothetical protein H6766_04170 [Candidatus Peribacteria bacterium]|nr:MAG: hypothetical protein H6766_04170 [Candidatus Peribacteria bacterium]
MDQVDQMETIMAMETNKTKVMEGMEITMDEEREMIQDEMDQIDKVDEVVVESKMTGSPSVQTIMVSVQ